MSLVSVRKSRWTKESANGPCHSILIESLLPLLCECREACTCLKMWVSRRATATPITLRPDTITRTGMCSTRGFCNGWRFCLGSEVCGIRGQWLVDDVRAPCASPIRSEVCSPLHQATDDAAHCNGTPRCHAARSGGGLGLGIGMCRALSSAENPKTQVATALALRRPSALSERKDLTKRTMPTSRSLELEEQTTARTTCHFTPKSDLHVI